MLDFDPMIEEKDAYRATPPHLRWMYNKLLTAEMFGYECAPSGVPMVIPGKYCIRPIVNLEGSGWGGFFSHVYGPGNQPDALPGYFWCEWFDGYHEWIDFTNDRPVDWSGGYVEGDKLVLGKADEPMIAILPDVLAGISRHLLLEHIDGNITEIAPRHMRWVSKPHSGDYIKDRSMPFAPTMAANRYWREIPKKKED